MGRTETKQEKDDLKENGNGDYKPANPQGKTVHIEGLKDMKMTELTKLAHDMDIQGASVLKKQDLMFKILQARFLRLPRQRRGHSFLHSVDTARTRY